MASIYARGNRLWCRIKDETGKWRDKPTPYNVGSEDKATRYARAAQAAIEKRRAAGATTPAVKTVAEYALGPWLEARREAEHDWSSDRGRLTKHVLPVLGDMPIADVQPVHIADLVRALRFRSKPRLAPRTVRNIYSVVAAMFRDAAIEGRISHDPCILTRAQLGDVEDADPEWRLGAVFTREEAEALISDSRIPEDRRIVYGFGLLLGLRPGEAAALRWRHYEPTIKPLGGLTVATSYSTDRGATKRTKTRSVKLLPVHPTLAAMLAEWRLGGWPAMFGRPPGPEDLIVPLPPETAARRTRRTGDAHRGYDYTGRRWREVDLPLLGWRPRAVYDMRSTFITLLIEDGGARDVIRERITHTRSNRQAFGGYDRDPHWLETCRELSKLRLARRPGLAAPPAAVVRIKSDDEDLEGSGGGFRTPESGSDRAPQIVDIRALAVDSRGPSVTPGAARLAALLVAAVLDDDLDAARPLALELAPMLGVPARRSRTA